MSSENIKRLSNATSRGALAVILAQGVNKLLTTVGQVVLAWFLFPDDMGLVAMATSVSAIGVFFTSSGVRDVLVQRRDQYDVLKQYSLSLSLVMNIVAAIVVAAIAPVLAVVYHEPRIVSLIWITVLSWPLSALIVPYSAKLAIDLDFKTLSRLTALEGFVFTASSMALAWFGFGAGSLVLPLLWKSLTTYVFLRRKYGAISFAMPSIQMWRILLMPSIFVTLASLAQAIQNNGVNYAAGIRGNSEIVGIYYWGYSIASQAVFLLALNLRQVFFPVFCITVSDHIKLRILAKEWLVKLIIIVVPVCLIQYLLANVLIQFFFAPHWWSAIPTVKYISLALIWTPLEIIGVSVLYAKGMYKRVALIRVLVASAIFIVAWFGAGTGSVERLSLYTAPVIALGFIIVGSVGWCTLSNKRINESCC